MIIDLTMPIYDGAKTFDEDPQCEIKRHSTIQSGGSTCSRLSFSSHHGTHMDAPLHFIEDGDTIDRIDLSACVGRALLLDFSHKQARAPITVEDFLPYQDKISKGIRLVYRTDFDRLYPQNGYFEDFPYLTEEAADWLAQRGIALLGMDTPTPNPIDFTYVHKSLLGSNVCILEGLTSLAEIGDGYFLLSAVPLKILDCDAAPVRAYAEIMENERI